MRKALLGLAGFALASFALCGLSKYKDWAKSPEAYFLTAAERGGWSKINTDEEAEKFIEQYRLKRAGPNPVTEGKEFWTEIQRRIAAGDQQFKPYRQKGSESVRGRLLVTLGGPSRVTQSRPQEEHDDQVSGGRVGSAGTRPEAENPFGSSSTSVLLTWIYDKDKFDPSWAIGEIRARVSVDAERGLDELQNRPEADRAIAKIAEKSIVSPTATAAAVPAAGTPPAASVGAAASSAPAAALPPPVAATLPAATRSVLEALLKDKRGAGSSFWGAAFRSVPGEVFYAFQLYVPADKAPATPVKFGGIVLSESGQEAAAYWEDATLFDMKTGEKADKVFDRSVVLPPGSYRAAFGLFSAEDAPAIVSSSTRFELEQKPNEFEVSPLILGDTLTPLTKRPSPTDPFVFGAEKPIRVEPKADRLFTRGDSLWYFYTVSNPTLPPVSAAASTAAEKEGGSPASTPPPASPGTAMAPGSVQAPAPTPEPVKPRIMIRVGVLKDRQPAFKPLTGPAQLQMLAPGYYASGSEIPLASFEPGYYTFTLNVRDLNAPKDSAANKGIDRQGDFVVLKSDGSLPEKPAPKPTARPKTAKP